MTKKKEDIIGTILDICKKLKNYDENDLRFVNNSHNIPIDDALNLDSLDKLDLLVELEKVYKIKISEYEEMVIVRNCSLNTISEMILNKIK
ncbi:MAG: hypothetical protein IJW75_02975 [Alphaproteobacteria bacterium]|nr:hypothetical protein [Alphaproteobacteria bacterium]